MARQQDVRALAAIELAAAELLRGHAPDAVLEETTPEKELLEAHHDGRLWVASTNRTPIGFAHVKLLEPYHAHLQELDVHPFHGRRGIGRRLVAAVCDWARSRGWSSVTLTTFRRLPFNMPFYAQVGFKEIPPAELSPALEAVLRDEVSRGLDLRERVVMRRTLASAARY